MLNGPVRVDLQELISDSRRGNDANPAVRFLSIRTQRVRSRVRMRAVDVQ